MPVTKQMKKNLPDEHPMIAPKKNISFGARASDRLTLFMGSWTFIILFALFLIAWMIVNIVALSLRWDPYPFILLNLFLSSLATFQAPIIMMSQNREGERDRIVAKYDYAVNRRAEREIQDIKKDLEEIKTLVRSLRTKSKKTVNK
ncbi:MAG: DUF1003 domain-containing protein [Candidatus Magasanikbacteria bacterium]|nr:DUF1003 domain-containing protein [Candidatus Magasanikbacteria bacterium]NCS72043.1 DUF1003 domain-containing protein [Candidatus Magasanikbacteria bacterium]